MDNRPIGVFDSGLGGLTVVRELLRELPGENIVYFGDTGRVPYGTRSRQTIETYTRQDCSFLQGRDVKMIIAACGTVSSVAPHILAELDVPAIGVVESAADAALAATKNGHIGIIGTAATVSSGSYKQRMQAKNPAVEVTAVACPLFVPLVENGWIEKGHPVTTPAAELYLQPLKEAGVDTLILGCTHFPLLAPIIADILPGVTLIDAGREAARRCARILKEQDLLADREVGEQQYCVSDHPADFSAVASMFLGQPVEKETRLVRLETIEGVIE